MSLFYFILFYFYHVIYFIFYFYYYYFFVKSWQFYFFCKIMTILLFFVKSWQFYYFLENHDNFYFFVKSWHFLFRGKPRTPLYLTWKKKKNKTWLPLFRFRKQRIMTLTNLAVYIWTCIINTRMPSLRAMWINRAISSQFTSMIGVNPVPHHIHHDNTYVFLNTNFPL